MSLTKLQTSVECEYDNRIYNVVITTPKISYDEIEDINVNDCKYELVRPDGYVTNITETVNVLDIADDLQMWIDWKEVWEDLKEIATLDNYLDIDPNA